MRDPAEQLVGKHPRSRRDPIQPDRRVRVRRNHFNRGGVVQRPDIREIDHALIHVHPPQDRNRDRAAPPVDDQPMGFGSGYGGEPVGVTDGYQAGQGLPVGEHGASVADGPSGFEPSSLNHRRPPGEDRPKRHGIGPPGKNTGSEADPGEPDTHLIEVQRAGLQAGGRRHVANHALGNQCSHRINESIESPPSLDGGERIIHRVGQVTHQTGKPKSRAGGDDLEDLLGLAFLAAAPTHARIELELKWNHHAQTGRLGLEASNLSGMVGREMQPLPTEQGDRTGVAGEFPDRHQDDYHGIRRSIRDVGRFGRAVGCEPRNPDPMHGRGHSDGSETVRIRLDDRTEPLQASTNVSSHGSEIARQGVEFDSDGALGEHVSSGISDRHRAGADGTGPARILSTTRTKSDHPGNLRIAAASIFLSHQTDSPVTDADAEDQPNAKSAGEETFDTSKTFADLGLPEDVLEGITKSGFVHPTKIQAALIPAALSGRHVLGQAKTGTGKTAAFGLPILAKVKPGDHFASLVLVPTRELAIQVANEIKELGQDTPLQVVPVYGGQRITAQAPKLEKGPEIVVGTPGRVMDLHERRMLPYEFIRMAVLDEVDRMLDIGFRDDIRKILGAMRQRPQTIFVSATISGDIEKLARSYMKDPEKIVTSENSLTVARVKQSWLKVEPWDKKRLLAHLIKHEKPTLSVIFCRTKRTVDDVTRFLERKNIDAHAIHGDMYQSKRNQVMDRLRDGSLGVLVASDLAARGLDVDGISHVINYDIPEDPEVYVHRIGRTARAGREGVAWTLVTPEQGPLLTACEMLANIEIPQAVYDDFEPGTVPSDIRAEKEIAEKRAKDRENLQKRTEAPAIKADDEAAFPGGLVPKAMPARRMQGKVRTRRR